MTRNTALAGLAIAAAASAAHASPTGGAEGAALAATATEPAVTIPVLDDGDRIFWKNNLRFASGDGQASYHIGGRIHYDGTWVDEDDAIKAAGFSEDDMWRFRRARLEFAGKVYGNIGFRADIEFAEVDTATGASETAFRNLYMSIDNFLIGELKIGQVKEPFSLEWQTSSNDITFLERSNADNLSPFYSTGFTFSDYDDDSGLGWAVGLYGAQSDPNGGMANVGRDGFAGTGRVTYAIQDEDDEDSLIHLGAALSIRGSGTIDTGGNGLWEISGFTAPAGAGVAVDDSTLFGLEAAGVFGPLSVQAEFISAANDLTTGGDQDATGFYILGSYFLTGETRNYDRGAFGRVTPESNWTGFGEGGGGAWEVALRYSSVDYDDALEITGLTAGVNWYLNANARLMANFLTQSLDNTSGGGALDDDAEALQLRFQVTF